MTIAICLVTSEGVVLGADSTSTISRPDGSQRYLNNEQKIFEVGERASIGVLTWGLGRIGTISHRSRIATLAADLAKNPPADLGEVARRFAGQLWSAWDTAFQNEFNILKQTLAAGSAPPAELEQAKNILAGANVGFCIAGCVGPGCQPEAFEVQLNANLTGVPAPVALNSIHTWGANLFIFRVLGMEVSALKPILDTGKWTGTPAELEVLLTSSKTPLHADVPLREAIDMVHSLLHMTVKLMKFTSLPPSCGGPIEIATVTTDRAFRWVRHKTLDAAIHAS